MAKRRTKKRTHVKPNKDEESKIPKSMCIRVGSSLGNATLNTLVRDFRNVMQPHTAIKLRERKSNKLRDYVVMCGPLGVSHLFIFSQSERTGNVHLRVARTPRGPTLTFKIESYSLAKDIKRFLRNPKSVTKESREFDTPSLLVLNGFSTANGEHEKVVISMLQNMFPPINPQQTKVNTIRRVLMINKDESGDISLRHYAIDVKNVEISKNVKKLINAKTHLHKKLPNLSKANDVSDLLLDPYAMGGYTSESEVEDDAIVSVKEQQTVKVDEREAQPDVKKKAIKLSEIGPRMQLRLVKIEDGVCSGKVMHHEFITKTKKEVQQLDKKHAELKRVKTERRKEQEANIQAKKDKKEAKKARREERKRAAEEGGEPQQESEESEESEEEYADVPEDLDSDLFSDVNEE